MKGKKVNETVTTYEPDNCLKKGYPRMFKEIIDEIKKNIWLIYQLFRRDFFTTYAQSIFGILWAFIIPIVSVGTFAILNASGLLVAGSIKVPYLVYAMLGLAFWQLFATGIVASSTSLVKAGPMIVKINFSKKALVISSMGQTLVTFLIQLALALIFFAFYRTVPNVAILLIPILIIPILLITLGLGLVLSVLNAVVRDLANLLPILMTFLLFLTPILYVKPTTGILAQITMYNPLYYLVSVPRDLALTGATTAWIGFLVSSILSIILFVACLVAFHLTETRIAERI
jgi:lipopolysaccharide transport system permease protein